MEAPFSARTYDGCLGFDGYESYVDYENSLWGPPPFIPVKITAGLASLSAFKAAAVAVTNDFGSCLEHWEFKSAKSRRRVRR
jgi:hypothetical protein